MSCSQEVALHCLEDVDGKHYGRSVSYPNGCRKYNVKDQYLQWMLKSLPLHASGKTKKKREKDNVYILLAALRLCSIKRDLQWGRRIHTKARKSRDDLNMYVVTALMRMYAKCSSMVESLRLFESIQEPDAVAWNVLILGYAENGDGLTALELFSKMKAVGGCAPDSVTYLASLKACTSLAVNGDNSGCLEHGREIHSEIGCRLDHLVRNAIVDMYAKCGSMADARQMFDSIKNPDVVCWTSLLMGYAQNGEGLTSLELFWRMKARGYVPDSVTYVAALMACTSMAANEEGNGKEYSLETGRAIHSEIGVHSNHYVQTALIDMYAKCSSMVEAHQVFDSIQNPDVVTWTALLLGYAENGEGLAALDLFSRMKHIECLPNSVTYIGVLKACGVVGALALGRKFHSDINDFSAHVVTCLVDFYAKCGSMLEARKVFDFHSRVRVVPTWNALLAGYASFGETGSVFNLFEAMQDQGFKPDAVTFVCMLSCCGHAGLLEKASEYFEAMPLQYRVTPTLMHYTCMIDVMGRANQLKEAVALLQEMPYVPNAVSWLTLLGACRKWKNVELGKWAFQSLVDMDSMMKLGDWKLPEEAYATNDVGNVIKFVVGEEDLPDVKGKLKQLLEGMKECGYVAKRHSLKADGERGCGHSERRAVVYGILRTPPSEPVRAFKNTKMCDDCHGSTKMISKLSGRVIMLRDAGQFHVMRNGSCSCGD